MVMHDGTGAIELFYAAIPNSGTFVFNDKFVLYPGDKLTMNLTNAGNVDILTTFIKQDWS